MRMIDNIPEAQGHKGPNLQLALTGLFLQPQDAPASLGPLFLGYFQFLPQGSFVVGLVLLPGKHFRSDLAKTYMIPK